MISSSQYVSFLLDEQRYILPLSRVERVVAAVYITPLPQAPPIILGAVNIQGHIVPVVNLRKRFHLPERELELSDQFLVAHTSRRTVALVVNTVLGIMDCPAHEVIPATHIAPDLGFITGVVKTADGIYLIHDLDSCLSLDEEQVLDRVLQAA